MLNELAQYVKTEFEEQEAKHGYTNPKAVAEAIINNDRSRLQSTIQRQVMRMPTKEFLYAGSLETVADLLLAGDHVVLWTQGHEKAQMWKVANSGIGKLRLNLPSGERQRLSVFAAKDKIPSVVNLVRDLRLQGCEEVFIVDDKSENIDRVNKQLQLWKEQDMLPQDFPVSLIWVNQGRTKNQVPKAYTTEGFKTKYATIEDIRSLSEIKRQKEGNKAGWLIDLDHTLINTHAAKNSMFQDIAKTITQDIITPAVSYEVDLKLGLNGNVKQVRELVSGMSGGRVLRVDTDHDSFVVKYNPGYPDRVQREIQGYHRLTDTPIGEKLPGIRLAWSDRGTLVLPFIEGVPLRTAIKANGLPEHALFSVVDELLRLKKMWWSNQTKTLSPHDLRSMQREEWYDTIAKVDSTLSSIETRFNLSMQDLWKLPLIFMDKEYPSLLEIMSRLTEGFNKTPPYTLLAHGDATGANIIVDPNKEKWTLIDTEWAGQTDPAEAFVRMVKHISTTTIQRITNLNATLADKRIIIDLDIGFPHAAINLQHHGLSKAQEFSQALADPSFTERVKEYLAGSYIRELALVQQRGIPELGLFAILKAGESLLM